MHQDRPLEPGLRLELGEQAVDVVDVPGALDLGDHDHVELVADLGHELGEVVEHPGALERVDPGPQRRVAEVGLLGGAGSGPRARPPCLSTGTASSRLPSRMSVCLAMSGALADHLLVREVEEVDHPRGLQRDLAQRLGGVDRQGLEEVSWVSQGLSFGASGIGARNASRPRPGAATLARWPSRSAPPTRGGVGDHRPVRVAVRPARVAAGAVGPAPGGGRAGAGDRLARLGGPARRRRGRAGRASAPLSGHALGPLRLPGLGRGPRGRPRAAARRASARRCWTPPRTGPASAAPPTLSSTRARRAPTPTASTSARGRAGARPASAGSSRAPLRRRPSAPAPRSRWNSTEASRSPRNRHRPAPCASIWASTPRGLPLRCTYSTTHSPSPPTCISGLGVDRDRVEADEEVPPARPKPLEAFVGRRQRASVHHAGEVIGGDRGEARHERVGGLLGVELRVELTLPREVLPQPLHLADQL